MTRLAWVVAIAGTLGCGAATSERQAPAPTSPPSPTQSPSPSQPPSPPPPLPQASADGFVQSCSIEKTELFLDDSPVAARTGEYFAFPVYTHRIRHRPDGTAYRTEVFEVVRVYRRVQERDDVSYDVRVTTREDVARGDRLSDREALFTSGADVQFVDIETGAPLVGYAAIRDAMWERGHRVRVELAMPGAVAQPADVVARPSPVRELRTAEALWQAVRRGEVVTLSARYRDDAVDLNARFAAIVHYADVRARPDGTGVVWIELHNKEYWGPRAVIDIGRFEISPGGEARVESYVEDANTGEVLENHAVRLRLGDTLRLFARPRG